jgi:hypothetical protein
MNKVKTFILSLSIVAYTSGASIYAQGNSGGHSAGPSASQGHGQSSTRGPAKTNSNQSGDHSKGPATKETWQTKLNDRVESDPAFRTRIEGLLPKGMDLMTAEDGFKNRGQFIAALHVSKNLNISFDLLKEKMTGIPATTTTTTTTATTPTTSSPVSMGKAIQELRPTLTPTQVTEEVKQAEKQAELTQKTTPTS